MITGFNTDIKHGERVFHVQTEDRGLSNPVIESLVYVGGEILLSKKSPYKEHVHDGRVDEKVVKELMDLQHRRIIEAIRRGRFDKQAVVAEVPADEMTDGGTPYNQVSAAAAAAAAAILSSKSGAMPVMGGKPASTPKAPAVTPRPTSSPNVPTPSDRTLDQVIMDYLAAEAASEHLMLSVMKAGEIVAGEAVVLTIRATTSLNEKPIAGAHVSVRVVSTVAPPQVIYRGVTGSDGLVKANCQVPDTGPAQAALIIAASSPLGNNETKEFIKRKSK